MVSVTKSHYAGRVGVRMENEQCRLFIQNNGGMTPVFALKRQTDIINSHWLPHFRGAPGYHFDPMDPLASQYWGGNLLFEAAGNFPCAPTFGSGKQLHLADIPAHGHTANLPWHLEQCGIHHGLTDSQDQIAYAEWSMASPTPWTLNYRKWDLLSQTGGTHTMLLEVTNQGTQPQPINLAWHTTLGEPLLCDGGLLSCNADIFATPPSGCEFDSTGRLAQGALFNSLKQVPLRTGDTADLSDYRLHCGHSDLICAKMSVSDNAPGWAAFINPHLNIGYLTLSPASPFLHDTLTASFCNFWLQQGGRNFTPWADEIGGPDRCKALGMEMAVGYFANGLAASLQHPQLLDNPTSHLLAPGQRVRFALINLLFTPTFSGNIEALEVTKNGIVIGNGQQRQPLECDIQLASLANLLSNP